MSMYGRGFSVVASYLTLSCGTPLARTHSRAASRAKSRTRTATVLVRTSGYQLGTCEGALILSSCAVASFKAASPRLTSTGVAPSARTRAKCAVLVTATVSTVASGLR